MYTWDMLQANQRPFPYVHDSMYRLQLQIREPHVDHYLPTRDEFTSFVDWPGDKPFHFVGEAGGSNVGHAGNVEDESSEETVGLEEESDNNED